MDRESKAALIAGMNTITEHINDVESYIITTMNSEDILISASGGLQDYIAMLRCMISNITQEMDVVNYSHLVFALTVYMRRLMEKRYGSDSELKEK